MDGNASLKKFHDGEAKRLRSYGKSSGVSMPAKYARGGAVKKPNTTINIVIGKDKPADSGLGALAALAPKPPPVTLAPPSPPAGGGPMPGGPGGPGGLGLPGGMGMKRGGKATALPMTAGAEGAKGRMQKAASEAKKEGKR